MADVIRLATRGSDLALRQAAGVQERLAARRREVDLVEVETRGDQVRDELIHRLGRTGAFVRALDERVLDGDCDAAVHSMKDVPTEFPPDLVVAGVPARGPAGDVLVTPDGTALADLPEGATVGTSSLRRRAQLLAERPDLDVRPLRGNVDTRVEKLLAPSLQREHERRTDAEESGEGDDGADEDGADGADTNDSDDDADGTDDDAGYERTVEEWFSSLSEVERRAMERDVDVEFDAVVLAEAGLERAGLLHALAYQRLPVSEFVPAPGQGALAVTARADGDVAATIRDALDDHRTRVETTVERTVLATVGGGCVAPIGVYAVVQGEYVHVTARVLDREGGETVERTRDLPVESHAEAAREFGADLVDAGAAELVERARRESGADEPAKRAESEDEGDEP